MGSPIILTSWHHILSLEYLVNKQKMAALIYSHLMAEVWDFVFISIIVISYLLHLGFGFTLDGVVFRGGLQVS